MDLLRDNEIDPSEGFQYMETYRGEADSLVQDQQEAEELEQLESMTDEIVEMADHEASLIVLQFEQEPSVMVSDVPSIHDGPSFVSPNGSFDKRRASIVTSYSAARSDF